MAHQHVDAGGVRHACLREISAADVTRHLSGVIYLVDKSITATDPTQVSVNASFIWNSNAPHAIAGHALEAVLKRRGATDLKTVD